METFTIKSDTGREYTISRAPSALKPKQLKDAGEGIFAECHIPKEEIIGKYKGKVHNKHPGIERYRYTLGVNDANGRKVYLDATDPADGNWTRYINDYRTNLFDYAENKEKQNVAFTEDGSLKTIKDISPGDELLAAYKDVFWDYERDKFENKKAGCIMCGEVENIDIWTAVMENKIDTVRKYIESGGDVDIPIKHSEFVGPQGWGWGYTPLHVAARWGRTEIVSMLLEAGAKQDVLEHAGYSYHLGRIKVIHSTSDKEDANPFYYAVYFGHLEAAKLLEKSKEDKNQNGSTLLHKAAEKNYLNMVETLLQIKADVNARDNRGRTPLHYCYYYQGGVDESRKVMALLIEHGAKVDIEDKEGKKFNEAMERFVVLPEK